MKGVIEKNIQIYREGDANKKAQIVGFIQPSGVDAFNRHFFQKGLFRHTP